MMNEERKFNGSKRVAKDIAEEVIKALEEMEFEGEETQKQLTRNITKLLEVRDDISEIF
jgi:hypothetical protein